MAVRAIKLRATPTVPPPPVRRARLGVDEVLVVLAAGLFLGFASRTMSAPFGRPRATVRLRVASDTAAGDAVMVADLRCVDGSEVASYEIRSMASLVDRPPALDFC